VSRRARQRATARPWLDDDEFQPFTLPDQHEDHSEPLYLSNGDRIDTRSAWTLPTQQGDRL
jgi:hypothetical protein